MLAGLVLAACGGGGGSGPKGSPVAVTVLSQTTCPSGPGALGPEACYYLEVDVPAIPALEVEARVFAPDPGTTALGTVLLASGGNGTLFHEELDGGDQLILDLRAQGFRVVDRRWTASWLQPGPFRAGAQRMTELARWLEDQVHAGGLFAAVGNSGGASELAYGLTTWSLGDSLDRAVLLSGPGFARLDYRCHAPPEWTAICPGNVPAGALECGTPSCIEGFEDPACPGLAGLSAAELLADSVLHPAAELDFPSTVVHVVVGAEDCGVSTAQSVLFHDSLLGPRELVFVPGTPHGVTSTLAGRDAVVSALLGLQPLQEGAAPAAALRITVTDGARTRQVSGFLPRRR